MSKRCFKQKQKQEEKQNKKQKEKNTPLYDPGYNIPDEDFPYMIDSWLEEEENELIYHAPFLSR